jgi:tyrosyl-tRNA synthetase
MDKFEKITANIEEIVTPEELKKALDKDRPIGYIGFEPSGSVHIGWQICTNKIKDFIECGFDFTVLLADWHAYINDKLGGDIEKIKLCGKYMEDCFAAMGVDISKIKFIYASDYVSDPQKPHQLRVSKEQWISWEEMQTRLKRTFQNYFIPQCKFQIFFISMLMLHMAVWIKDTHICLLEMFQKN